MTKFPMFIYHYDFFSRSLPSSLYTMGFSLFKPSCGCDGHANLTRRDLFTSLYLALSGCAYQRHRVPNARTVAAGTEAIAITSPPPREMPSSNAYTVLATLSAHSYAQSRTLYNEAADPAVPGLDRIDALVAGDYHNGLAETLLQAGIAPAGNPALAIEPEMALGPAQMIGEDTYHSSVRSRAWADSYMQRNPLPAGLHPRLKDMVGLVGEVDNCWNIAKLPKKDLVQ